MRNVSVCTLLTILLVRMCWQSKDLTIAKHFFFICTHKHIHIIYNGLFISLYFHMHYLFFLLLLNLRFVSETKRQHKLLLRRKLFRRNQKLLHFSCSTLSQGQMWSVSCLYYNVCPAKNKLWEKLKSKDQVIAWFKVK